MDEAGIKAAVLTRIRKAARGRSLPVVSSEFRLNGTGIRADLAILDDESFYGVEIKSAADSLKRLPSQLDGYARYFDRTVLVVAPRHLHGLREIDLCGAEVWRQEVLTDWQLHRTGEVRHTSGQWLLQLLTADEERRVIRQIERGDTAASGREPDQLRRQGFEAAFRKRYAATSELFWSSVRSRKIVPEDIQLLSRYRAERQQLLEIERQRVHRWEGWASAIATAL